MPVALITIHAYRSWREDNPRGYVQRGAPGIQPPNPGLARHRAAIAKHPPVRFNDAQQRVLIDGARDLCVEHDWRLHAVSATPTHLHALVSWTDRSLPVREITNTLKRQLGRRLSKHKGTLGNRWFSRGQDEEPITQRQHLDHICDEYLPRHVHQRGRFWREGLQSSINEHDSAS